MRTSRNDIIKSAIQQCSATWGEVLSIVYDLAHCNDHAKLYHRRDYHEDGGHTDFYYFELPGKDYKGIGCPVIT